MIPAASARSIRLGGTGAAPVRHSRSVPRVAVPFACWSSRPDSWTGAPPQEVTAYRSMSWAARAASQACMITVGVPSSRIRSRLSSPAM